ncbi:MAG: class I SAM-dependent methyltransferase [Burkholderiales bacterium]|nr:class I SAM-dependent methyltransferase [Burkholderiales bacterium]
MPTDRSVAFFDAQFRRRNGEAALALNPFEVLALPYLSGHVLDFGCGLGNLAFAAARRGCTVVALDASPAAIEHVRARAVGEALPVSAALADLRDHAIDGAYDAIVSIGLLMFFDCPTALRVLAQLQAHVRPGGVAAVNVLVEGTTYLEMFDPRQHCLFAADELRRRFAGWHIEHDEVADFEAPRRSVKRFATVIARKPAAAPGARA